MKKSPNHSSERAVPVTLKITARDIAEMEYHLNECPMTNLSLQNAVTFALRRIVKKNLHVAVHITPNEATAEIGKWTCSLGSEVGVWLEKVLTGHSVQPRQFRVHLPRDVVRADRQLKVVPKSRLENEGPEYTAISA